MRNVLSFVAALLLTPLAAFAQAPQTPPAPPAAEPGFSPVVRTIEFEDAISQALAKNPTVGTAMAAIARSEALLEQSRAAVLPSVNAGVSSITLDNRRGFEGTTTQPRSQFAMTATANVPVLAFSGWANVNQARDQVEVSQLASTDVRQQVASATASAYLAVIGARRQVEVDELALENAQAHFDYADRRLQGGVGSRLNQLRAAQQLATDQTRLEATRMLLRRAQEALGVLVVENGPVDAGGEPVFDIPVEIKEEEWMVARPDLQVQSATVRAAERLVADAWRSWLPSAGLAFEPQYYAPSSALQPSATWRLLVSVSQPVFQRGIRAETALKKVVLSQAQFARTTAEIQARSEVRVSREAVAASERAVARSREAADAAAEVLRIATSAFEVGATTNLEVIDAQRSARETDTAAALSEDARRRARLDLLVALGRFRH